MDFAILDIETTGGKYGQERITEIAIYRFDGHDITDKFVSLLNPQRPIQSFVQKLTGITDNMVKRAPKFEMLAKRIIEITERCIIVAHNADFDYRMLRQEFRSLGYQFNRDTLCTVELSKKLIPDEESYSLGKLCKSLGIPIAGRHRAEGDAFATVQLLELLLQKDQQHEIINRSIKSFSSLVKKEKIVDVINGTPAKTGVFYLHQQNGRIMYIGKGKNMRQKLSNFLSRKSKKVQNIQTKLASISYDLSGNYLLASLIFNQKVAIHKPRYNSDYLSKKQQTTFPYANMMLVNPGRSPEEKAVILIAEGKIRGFAFTHLAYQMIQPEILEKIISPLNDSLDNRYIVKDNIEKQRIHKIIEF